MTHTIVHASTVDFIDKLGTDLTVVNAARVSFDKESSYDLVNEDGPQLKPGDVKLLAYLAKHDHWSPFAHAQLQLRITAPIFVARQLVKHQIGLVWNEVSRRYVTDEPTFYLPTKWRGMPIAGMKQGSSGEVELSKWMDEQIHAYLARGAWLYERLMKSYNVCAEQARMFLPLNLMTSWYWTGSLYAIARVCKLRLDPHAQGEATEVGLQMHDIAMQHFPHAFKKLMSVVADSE